MLTSAPSSSWNSVTSSADGTKLMAVSNDGSIYDSTDSGSNWTLNSLNDNCIGAASSADGSVLATASTSDGLTVYYSVNSGTAWGDEYPWGTAVPVGTEYIWSAIATSADGLKLAIATSTMESTFGPFKGIIFSSTNGGYSSMGTNNHVGNIFPTANWTSVALSADGNKLVAVSSNGLIYTSTNTGATCRSNLVPSLTWTGVASSADGMGLVAVSYSGSIYTSTNSGSLWNSNGVSGMNWTSVASSADGARLVAASANGSIYTSTNSGTTWQPSYALTNGGWAAVASSADGYKLVAAASNGGIYTLQATPQLALKMTLNTAGVAVSWTVPSQNFQIQQNLNPATTNWQTLTNLPQLNLTNLQNVLLFKPTNSQGVFRLISR